MYNSIREWCRFPVYLHKFTTMTVSGDSGFASPITLYGYRVDEMKKVIDKEGKEYISATQVYLSPETVIAETDKVAFPDDTEPREIRLLSLFSDGSTGNPDIYVVYL